MDVALLGMKGNFNNKLGQGTQRYMHELWKNISMIKHEGINVRKLELGFGKSDLARKVSFTFSVAMQYMGGYDIVHVLHPIMFNPPLRKRTTKIITTINEFIVLEEDNPYRKAEAISAAKKGFKLQNIARNSIGSVIRNQMLESDYLLTISDKTRREAIRLGVERDRIFVVNLGLDERFTTPLNKKKRNTVFKVGFIGGFNIRKNAIFAIRAFRHIPNKDLVFELWGKPMLEYDKCVEAASGDRRIQFKGFAPEDKLVDVYEGFDVFVYPSLYAGLELEILEAQARGIPVIIYEGGNITKEARYYFAARDEKHMAEIIMDLKENGFDEAKRLKAMKYAQSFTWRKTAENTVEVYRDIMGRSEQ